MPPGTDVGELQGPLAELPAFRGYAADCAGCHDTASAIAAMPDAGDDWAYISSGTWSLVGTLLDAAGELGRGARRRTSRIWAGRMGQICFHKNVNGMWLMRQCMEQWSSEGAAIDLAELVDGARRVTPKDFVLDVDDAGSAAAGEDAAADQCADAGREGLPEFRTDVRRSAGVGVVSVS